MPTRLSVVERDVVSHCALRLALCGEDEPHLGQWFVSAELRLLRWRFDNAVDADVRSNLLRCFATCCDFARADASGRQDGNAVTVAGVGAGAGAGTGADAGTDAGGEARRGENEEYEVPWQAALAVVRRRSGRRCALRVFKG